MLTWVSKELIEVLIVPRRKKYSQDETKTWRSLRDQNFPANKSSKTGPPRMEPRKAIKVDKREPTAINQFTLCTESHFGSYPALPWTFPEQSARCSSQQPRPWMKTKEFAITEEEEEVKERNQEKRLMKEEEKYMHLIVEDCNSRSSMQWRNPVTGNVYYTLRRMK